MTKKQTKEEAIEKLKKMEQRLTNQKIKLQYELEETIELITCTKFLLEAFEKDGGK